MRIIVSTPTFLPVVGGAQLGIHEIYHRLGKKHEVTILTPHLPRHSLEGYGAQDYTSDNYEVRYIFPSLERALPYPVKRALKRTSWLYTAELTRTVRRARPDAINFHFIKPHGGALIAVNKLYGVPTALSLVGRSDVMQQLSTSKRWYAKQVIDRADVVLPNSTYYLGSKVTGSGIQIIPYGVDIEEFAPSKRRVGLRQELGLSDDHFVLFSVQRLTPVKRVDLLIRVMAEIVPQNPRVILLIGGKGEEESNLRALVDELHLRDNVKFCGYIDSVRLPEYFASADAFVFHSLIETFGIVFAQAMASGLPIIAADTSCVSDVLTLNNGPLITPFDTIAFAGAVLSLAESPETARRIGTHNRAQAVNEFDWDRIAAQYERALHDIAASIR
jgi:glycosyltransferase involved in cell wall biosynthesis